MARTLFRVLALCSAAVTAFFTYYGVRLVYAVVTFSGEGSLGHVGMYMAAALFPALAVLFGVLTFFAWRAAARRGSEPPPVV